MPPTKSGDPNVARLALCGRAEFHGAVDGAWWPNSLNLQVELPDLVAVLGSWIGPIRRVVYDPSSWLPAPSRLIRRESTIPVDPYQLTHRDTILLLGTHSRDAVLFVIPPSCTRTTVTVVLRQVQESMDPLSAVTLRDLLRTRLTDGPA